MQSHQPNQPCGSDREMGTAILCKKGRQMHGWELVVSKTPLPKLLGNVIGPTNTQQS